MNNIPIIIPVFNQLTYLKNIINWWKWYYPENPIVIVDNGSTYEPLLEYYGKLNGEALIYMREENNCIDNLRAVIQNFIGTDYYVISDPDIMPHPNTPANFLEIFKKAIDVDGFHRAGFGLITSDLPEWLNERAMIIGNEAELKSNPVNIDFDGKWYAGFKAPIDTTFCLYKKSNGGWSAPMNGKDWGNCLRIFDAFHLGWYQHPVIVNSEMDFYFKNAKYRVPGEPSAGKNNNRPEQYK